jgi:lipoprotein-anchoring transpeptidase ErfK/SrfK
MRRIVLCVLVATLAVTTAACQGQSNGAAPGPATSSPAASPSSEPSPSDSPSPSPSSSAVSPSPAATSAKPSAKPSTQPATCQQGEHQAEVENHLNNLGSWGKVVADGKQSDADCAVIKKFQSRFGISPANGRAGSLTVSVARRISNSDPGRCGAGAGITACIDLSNQTTWIMRDGQVIAGPTVTRTGMNGYETPEGTYKINEKALKSWSNDWDVWLPYWQRIVRGIGYHQTTTYIHNGGIGSHGCVNLLPADAVKFYETLKTGNAVKIFGRRPGT